MPSSKRKDQREVEQLRHQLRVLMKEFYGHLKCLQRVINSSEEVEKCRVLYGEIIAHWQRVWLTLKAESPISDLSEAKVLVQELRNKVDEFGHFIMCLTFELSTFIPPEGILDHQRQRKPAVNVSQKVSSSNDTILDVEDHLQVQHKIRIEGGGGSGGSSLAHDKLPQWVAKLMLALSGQIIIQLLTAQMNDQSSTARVTLAVVKAANVVGFVCLLIGLNICRRKSLASYANILQRIGAVLVAISLIVAMSADLPVKYLLMCTLLLAAPVTVVLSAF